MWILPRCLDLVEGIADGPYGRKGWSDRRLLLGYDSMALVWILQNNRANQAGYPKSFEVWQRPHDHMRTAWAVMSTQAAKLKTFPPRLVPDAPCPVVRDGFLTSGLQLLHEVVQEKVDQDGVDLDLRMGPFDISPNELHAPDAASFTDCQPTYPRPGLESVILPLN